jgi:phospholipase C
VNTINQIEKSKFWKNTAIVIAYDDSDGWYDHQKPVIVNGSNTSLDAAICSSSPVRLAGIPVRCGYSQRLPMLVISPWARTNYVSHQLTNIASIIKFAENNSLGGKRIGGGSFDASSNSLSGMLQFFAPRFRPVILDPTTGAVARK